MTLVRWQPRTLFDFHNDFSRFFEGFGNKQRNGDSGTVAWRPAMDVSETENEWVVQVELPGLSKEDIKVGVENDVLSIEGEKGHESSEDKDKRYHRAERTYGTFKRSFTLPSAVDTEKISADYRDGVLTLTLPKAEAAKPKEIEVKVA